MAPCTHELVYDEVCTLCFEPCSTRHAQKIFDNISGVSVKGKLLEEKVQSITGGNKMIMILDLDNTIIHAKMVAPNFSLQDYYKEDNHKGQEESFITQLKKIQEFDDLD